MRMMRSPLGWIFGLAMVGLVIWVGTVAVAYETIPDGNTEAQRFDALIVLGTTAAPDGTPSPEMRERVEEGVRQYRAGVAPHLIMTGGAAHNQFAEGHVMAGLAESEGVPKEAIVEEDRAQNTIQNIWYSRHIMDERGWRSAEVVSSPYHLPRTALILREYGGTAEDFQWRTHGGAVAAGVWVGAEGAEGGVRGDGVPAAADAWLPVAAVLSGAWRRWR